MKAEEGFGPFLCYAASLWFVYFLDKLNDCSMGLHQPFFFDSNKHKGRTGMDFHKLLFIISSEFLDSVRNVTYDDWLDDYEGSFIITKVDFERAKTMLLLKDRKVAHRPLEVSNLRDSLVVIYNWSLIYANKLELGVAYERFIAFITKYNFKSITTIPNYQESLRMAFEYVYNYISTQCFNDDDLPPPFERSISFVKSWIADILMSRNIDTINEVYAEFLKRVKLPADELGPDVYFKRCFSCVDRTLSAM